MAKALEGIRVLDFTQWLQGPVCAQHLADFGAEVIHVERPGTGDGARGVRSIKALPVGDWNQYFLVINRNKKSMAIDLKKKEGQELFYELVEKADVFLSNFPMDVLKALKLDYEKLKEVNPRIIYATNTGYGHAVEVNRPSYDINVQALTGIMTRQGEPGQPPIYLGMGSGDTYGGIMSALGIMLALYQRRRTGVGQFIDASLYGAQLFMGAPTLQPFLASGKELYSTQQSRKRAGNPLWNRYQAQDKWLFLCEENTDESWSRLCQSFDRADLADADLDVAATRETQQPRGHARPHGAATADRGHRHEIERLGRGQNQPQREGVVHVAADVGVEQDLARRRHGISITSSRVEPESSDTRRVPRQGCVSRDRDRSCATGCRLPGTGRSAPPP